MKFLNGKKKTRDNNNDNNNEMCCLKVVISDIIAVHSACIRLYVCVSSDNNDKKYRKREYFRLNINRSEIFSKLFHW